MKLKAHLLTAALVTSLTLGSSLTALAASKKGASPSPSASPSAAPAAKEEKAPRSIAFNGTATAVDQSGKMFTIAGKKKLARVFKVTDKTTVTKAGNPATMADLMDNDAVTGSYWKQADGTLEARSLKIGGKTDADKAGKKSKKEDAAAMASPSPSASPKK